MRTHKWEQGFFKFKFHTSKEKISTMEFLLPAKLLFTPTKTSSYLEVALLPLFPSFSNYFTSYSQPHYFSLPIQAPPCDIFLFFTYFPNSNFKRQTFFPLQISPFSYHLLPLFYLYPTRPNTPPPVPPAPFAP